MSIEEIHNITENDNKDDDNNYPTVNINNRNKSPSSSVIKEKTEQQKSQSITKPYQSPINSSFNKPSPNHYLQQQQKKLLYNHVYCS